MATTKNKICRYAKILFNEKGYNNVSLRDIAKAAGTSIGNLTYHFPQKKDLVLSMQEELFTEVLKKYIDTDDGVKLFENLLQFFWYTNEKRKDNVFFYKNIVEISQESDTIARNIEEFRVKAYRYYQTYFLKLKEHAIMRSDITENQYETLAYIIVCMYYMWTQNTTQYYDKDIPEIELQKALKDLIFPYLTEYGKDLYYSLSSKTWSDTDIPSQSEMS